MIRKIINSVKGESLYINSFYTMASSIVTAGLGFLFWLISAHTYTPEQVGIASSLISAMGFISYLSLLGFNTTFIRFLPTSKRRNAEINTGLILVLCAALVTSVGYLLLVPHIAPSLSFLPESWMYSIVFIILCALAAINFLTDSVFIAFRAAQYNFLIYSVMGVVKLCLPIAFIGWGAYGLFGAFGAASAIGLLTSLYFMAKRFGYKMEPKIHKQTLKEVLSFSSGNYVVNLLNILPPLVIPFIIINQLGAAANGYYYLAFMLINLVYAVSYAVTQSLFVEGSYADKPLGQLVKRAGLILAGVILPATALFALCGPWLLMIFGKNYSEAAGQALSILSLAAPFVSLYVMVIALLRVTRKTFSLILLNLLYVVLVVGLVFWWVPYGLSGVAWAWLSGHAITSGVGVATVAWQRHVRRRAARTIAP